jgi:hypothetical protein
MVEHKEDVKESAPEIISDRAVASILGAIIGNAIGK